MRPNQQREASKRVIEVRDATPATIAKYLQPSAGARGAQQAPAVNDTLDQFVRKGASRGGSRPGTAGGTGSIFRPTSASKGPRIATDSVFPNGKDTVTGFDESFASISDPSPRSSAPPPSVFGGRSGGIDRSAVWPDNVAPTAAAMGAAAARPRADPTSAAAEFAALGLGGVGFGSKSGGFASGKAPMYSSAGMGGAPMGMSGFGQRMPTPSHVAQMRALPAAGGRSAPREEFRLG